MEKSEALPSSFLLIFYFYFLEGFRFMIFLPYSDDSSVEDRMFLQLFEGDF